jgi:hypothetical protein
MHGNWIPALLTALIFLVVGVVCLFWPRGVQRWGLRFYERRRDAAKYNLFLDWMDTDEYVLSLRLIGLVGVAVFVLFVFVFVGEIRQ